MHEPSPQAGTKHAEVTDMRSFAFVLSVSALVLTVAPNVAHACGGFFCNSTPVEQNAERILFEVDLDNEIVTATVEIQYTGDADDFAWVVPVLEIPDDPQLEIAPGSLMTLLEASTNKQLIFPPTTCTRPPDPPFVFSESVVLAGGDDIDRENGIDVTELEQVGPYAPQRIRSDDADALIEWLNTNGYLITSAMEPAVQEYVAQGYDFLGMKLAPDAGVTDIQPIVIQYPGTEPMVPVVLTSVAAGPEMPILTFIAGASRWESSNYANLELDDDERVMADPRTGRDNYYSLARFLTDDSDGRAVVTEFAAPTSDVNVQNVFLGTDDAEEALLAAQAVLDRNSVLTRMLARISSHEMTLDPTFAPSDGGNVDATIDLSDRETIEICAPHAPELSSGDCANTYCGVGASCATTDQGDGCVCPAGQTARSFAIPGGINSFGGLNQTVACISSEDFLSDVTGTPEGPADPCVANICGSGGTCVAVNGFATCACDDGFAAVPNGVGTQTCAAVIETFDATSILWLGDAACSSSCSATDTEASLWGLLLLPLLMRRRRA